MADPVAAANVAATAAIIAASISGVAVVVTSTLTIMTTRKVEGQKIAQENRRDAQQRAQQVSRFSEPLARSAYDLQSRIFNVLKQGLINAYLVRGNARERAYVINNTVYLIAQHLCWTELVRKEIQFIDLGENDRTRELLRLQDTLYSIWGTDRHDPVLRIFAGEQRAIGEALINPDPRGPECMGYGQFLKAFPKRANALIDDLRADVGSLTTKLGQATDRLVAVQHALIDLLDMLDPEHIRFPLDRRSKV